MNKNIITPLLAGAMLFSLSAVETGNRIPARGLALDKPGSDFRVVDFTRDALGPKDILIEIDYSGICHSDIHSALNEHAAPGSEPQFPIIPGHEMAGHVVQIGADVKKFAVGDLAGVGCFVDSCGKCRECRRGLEQFCEMRDPIPNLLKAGRNFRGGYSNRIVVPERNAIKIPAGAELSRVAPLLCAGITVWSPSRGATRESSAPACGPSALRRNYGLVADSLFPREEGRHGRRRRFRRARPHGSQVSGRSRR